MKRLILLAAAALSLTAWAAIPAGYYSGLDGKKQAALKAAAKAAARNHTVINYGTKTWEAFKTTDVRYVDGVLCWWDMYSNTPRAVADGHDGLNIEHSVPKSWWGGSQIDSYKDIHHLNPSDAQANSAKSNYPYGIVVTATFNNGVSKVGTPASGTCGGAKKVFEPADEYKGDFARTVMYIYTVYDDNPWMADSDDRNYMFDGTSYPSLRPWAYQMLLQWAAADPVSQKERDRNEAVYQVQGNRNPFIDYPELAEYIWGSKQNETFYTGSSSNPDAEDEIIYTALAASDTSAGDWTLEPSTIDGTRNVWSWKSTSGNYYLSGSAYGSNINTEAVAYSPVIDLTGMTDGMLSFEHAAKFQTNLRTACKAVVRDADTDTQWTELDIPLWPTAGTWNFVNSGNIDLNAWSGHRIRIGFLYRSTPTEADTWEINNVKVTARRSVSTVIDNSIAKAAPVAYSPSHGVLSILTEGTGIDRVTVYDTAGRLMTSAPAAGNVSVALPSGLYIVTYSTQAKASKVVVK